jgi:hypothetical protein
MKPVAWGMMNDDGQAYDAISDEAHTMHEGEYTTPLYALPPGHVIAPIEPTEAMRAVIRNDHGVYDTEEAFWAALIEASQMEAT